MMNAIAVRWTLVLAAAVALAGLALMATVQASAAGIQIASISPSSGPAGMEALLTIRGTGFPVIDDCEGAIIDVKLDGLSAFPVDPPTSTQVRVVAPAHPAGPVDVTVTNMCDGSSDTIENGYTYLSKGILSGSIPQGGGFGLFVFGGGSNDDLVEASECPRETATFWATDDGAFVTFIPGTAIEAVNEAWNTLFADGIPYNTALIGRCVA